jgi:hypothetical protein
MNRHARVIQQRKIAHLEARLARLEREAGLIDDFVGGVKSLGRKIINIPKNYVLSLGHALNDALQTVAVDMEKDANTRKESAGMLLAARIHRAMVGVMGVSTADIPTIYKFDKANPIKSLFVGGPAGSKPTPLSVLANMYEGEEQKRIKGAFQSWFADYKSVFGAPKSNGFKLFLEYVKKYSKTLYRLFTALLKVALPVEIMNLPWRMAASSIGSIFSDYTEYVDLFGSDLTYANKLDFIGGVGGATLKETLVSLSPSYLTSYIQMALALLEKAFYKWGVKTDMFDEMEAQGKTASYHRRVASTSYPRIASVINYLEAQAVQ